jgi:hypothetical protein
MTGCSSETARPRLETLHLAGVTEVASVYDLLKQSHQTDVRLIGSLMLTDPTGARRSYLAFMMEPDLYAVLPNGSDIHVIYTDVPCYLSAYGAIFSSDGYWLACADPKPIASRWRSSLTGELERNGGA